MGVLSTYIHKMIKKKGIKKKKNQKVKKKYNMKKRKKRV
jgi:hypothetical protein